MPSYRRRSFRRYRRRPYRKSYRPMRRSRYSARRTARRPKYFRAKRMRPTIRAVTTYDRTPNWDGDAVITQYKETLYNGLTRTTSAPNNYFVGAYVPGSHFSGAIFPDNTEYLTKYRYMKVLKSTIVVQFFNLGSILKDVGVLMLPSNVTPTSDSLPVWDASNNPPEQPRVKNITLGAGTSSRSVGKVIMSGTPLSAEGDKDSITAGDTKINIETGDIIDEPTTPWYFYLYQGNSGFVQTGSAETSGTNNVQYKATVYHTVKFFERIPPKPVQPS